MKKPNSYWIVKQCKVKGPNKVGYKLGLKLGNKVSYLPLVFKDCGEVRAVLSGDIVIEFLDTINNLRA